MISRFRPASDGRALNIVNGNKAASTVITADSLLTRNASGLLIPAVNASTNIAGVSMVDVVATDPNYAATSEIQLDFPMDGDEFIMDVDDAATAGFVAGVKRSILNANTVKAAADTAVPNFIVVKRVMIADNQAVVSLIANADIA
jgi:hypothetical protein